MQKVSVPRDMEDIRFAQTQIRRFAEAQRASMTDIEVETLPGVILGHRNIPVQSVGCLRPRRQVPDGRLRPHVGAHGLRRGRAPHRRLRAPGEGRTAPRHRRRDAHGRRARDLRPRRHPGRGRHGARDRDDRARPHARRPRQRLRGRGQAPALRPRGHRPLRGADRDHAHRRRHVDAELCATDLLGQAEHGYNSPACLLTTSRKLAEGTMAEVDRLLDHPPTAETARVSWRDYGEVILCDTHEEMLASRTTWPTSTCRS
jgi:sulfopropanediol 3-dehydrogenase